MSSISVGKIVGMSFRVICLGLEGKEKGCGSLKNHKDYNYLLAKQRIVVKYVLIG